MTGNSINICIIGAGSAQFTLDIIRDLCLTEGLKGANVCLLGHINKEKINQVHNVGTRYSDEMGANLKFRVTYDRRDALRGADFVINVAGLKPPHPVRQMVFFMDVVRDMEELCPDAWLLVAANPVFAGCTLMTRESSIKVVGLCHGFREGVRNIAEVMGLELENVHAQAAGVNHNIWMTHFFYRGQDAYPLLDEWIETKAEEYWQSPEFNGGRIEWSDMGPKPIDIYKFFGLMPLGDTQRFSNLWWYNINEETERKFMAVQEEWWEVYRQNTGAKLAAIVEAANHPSEPVSKYIPPRKSTGHDHINIINAIANDHPGEYQVNIPNDGAIDGIPDDVVVEIPAFVSGRGIQGIRIGRLPEMITLHLQGSVIQMEYEVKALQMRNPNLLVYGYLQNRNIKSIEEARKRVQELLDDSYVARYFEYKLS